METIKRVIQPQITGLSIKNILVNQPQVIAHPSVDVFSSLLVGQTFSGMTRRGKFLNMMLESGDQITLHLRMTGCLLLTPSDFPQEKHTHFIFQLNNGKELRFSDMRRFGRLWLLQKCETDTYTGMDKLGIEPFDSRLNATYLTKNLGKRKKTIKECLLEQRTIAGIGNIYADEILFTAGIYPARFANSLTKREWERLAAAIPERLAYFIQKNKITPKDYLEAKGQDYRNTPFLQVYGHAGEPCPVCGTPLCRIVLGGRSSTYCRVCQVV